MILYVHFNFTEKFVFTTENGNVKQICHMFSRRRRLHNRHSLSQNVDLVIRHNADLWSLFIIVIFKAEKYE